jgi:DNA-binding FadR family transcriptional regulator
LTVYRRPDPIPLRSATGTPRAAGLTPVRAEPDSLNRLVARDIFLAIVGGRFPAGSILPNEHELAASLGVSRTALREAVKGLASKGLLETRRKRGTLVLEREHWNLLDAELIAWSRRDNGARTSRELWEAVAAVQAPLAAEIARGGHGMAVVDAAARLQAAHGAEERRAAFAQLLVTVAAAGNPYLRALNAACLGNLVKDDPAFLDAEIGRMRGETMRSLAEAIRERRPETAFRAMQRLFTKDEDAVAELLGTDSRGARG